MFSMKALLFAAALAPASVSGFFTACCIDMTCDECHGLGGFEEPTEFWSEDSTCYDKGYFSENGNDGCVLTGAPPNGDCYDSTAEPWCLGTTIGTRVSVEWCAENGGTAMELVYEGFECLPLDEVEDMRVVVEMEGDPHVKTWGGTWFDYQGECDLVLIEVPDFKDGNALNIHVRTTIRYDYSYIEAAAMSIGDEVLEVGSWGEYWLNGVDSAPLKGATLAGYPVYYREISEKNHKFDVVISHSENITISNFKDMVAVKVTGASHDRFGKTHGIMGDYDGVMKGRNGAVMTVESPNAIGQEWQVQADEPMLFQVARSPQAPTEECRLPNVATAEKKRLGQDKVSKDVAEAACAHLKGDLFENCVVNVIAIGDVDIAAVV